MRSIEDIFTVLKKIKPKMRVTAKNEIRMGKHCPITALAVELRMGDAIEGAGDYTDAARNLGLNIIYDNDLRDDVNRFVEAADHSLSEMGKGADPKVKQYRRRLFKTLGLPANKL